METYNGLISMTPQTLETASGDNNNTLLDSSNLFVETTNDMDALTGLKIGIDNDYTIWISNTSPTNTLILKDNNSGTDAGYRFRTSKDLVIRPRTAIQMGFISGVGWVPIYLKPEKRQESYSGITDASGSYTVVFDKAYPTTPNIQHNVVNQSAVNQFSRVASVSDTGFTINVFERNSVNISGDDVLLSSTVNVSGASVDVLITEK